MSKITSFTGQYQFLSNFYPCQIVWQGLDFPTAEHLYQFRKMYYPLDAEYVRVQITPGRARKVAHKLAMRLDWEQVKQTVMVSVLYEKFRMNPSLWGMLQDTKPNKLIEGNKWKDMYWGMVWQDGEWRGKNILGELLMFLRDNNTNL